MNNELVSWCLRHLQEQKLWPWKTGWNPQIGDDPKEKDESHGERQLPWLTGSQEQRYWTPDLCIRHRTLDLCIKHKFCEFDFKISSTWLAINHQCNAGRKYYSRSDCEKKGGGKHFLFRDSSSCKMPTIYFWEKMKYRNVPWLIAINLNNCVRGNDSGSPTHLFLIHVSWGTRLGKTTANPS